MAATLAPTLAGTIAGYRLEALRAQERRLLEESRLLDFKIAELQRPDRLQRLAAEHNLVTPAAGQVFHLDSRPDGAVALAK
jgi:hypothetical protein